MTSRQFSQSLVAVTDILPHLSAVSLSGTCFRSIHQTTPACNVNINRKKNSGDATTLLANDPYWQVPPDARPPPRALIPLLRGPKRKKRGNISPKRMKLSHAFVALVIALFADSGCIQAASLEVKEGNSPCIKAELSATFSITYNTSISTRTVHVSLPDSATVDERSSSCREADGSSWMVALFGSGHTLGLRFTTNGSLYSVANLTLQYNLSDTSIFRDASETGVITVASPSVGIWAMINTTYSCVSPSTFRIGDEAVTFTNVRLQAFMLGDDLSPTENVCTADIADTTTTASTSTSTTTTPPPPTTTTTTTTTVAPAPTPVPTPPGTPERGTYSVTNGNGTACLLAQMGLQLNVSYLSLSQNKTVQELVNLTPNLTRSSGSCEASSASLVLSQGESTTLNFTFTLNTTSNKYHLSGISLVANWSDSTAPLSASNSSLDYLRSTLGRSYMCNAQQTLVVVSNFSVNTFRLQVQPFNVTTNQFATAEECQVDQDQMLIPIIVGAALAGLVLIVLIAYLIGRKRSHAGYQTI
ncbi:lysosome-associated membrane glycoprotein 1a [Gasterosteus aculeatus]